MIGKKRKKRPRWRAGESHEERDRDWEKSAESMTGQKKEVVKPAPKNRSKKIHEKRDKKA